MGSRSAVVAVSLALSACGANTVDPCGTVIPPGLRVVDIEAASSHTCVRFEDGSVACWGLNGLGETGAVESHVCPRPMFLTLPRGHAVALSLGHQSTTVLLDDGAIVSWGALAHAVQEFTGAEYTPLARLEWHVDRTRRIADGGTFACMLDDAGIARCWGRNVQGMLGRGSFDEGSATVAPVDGSLTFSTISASEQGVCGVERGGAVSCWGTAGGMELHAAPFRIAGVSNATDVVASGYERCALATDHTVACWGGTRGPARVEGLGDVEQIAGGGALCAVANDGVVRCWLPPDSTLGASEIVMDHAPREIAGLPRVIRIAVGKSHACALGDDASVWCWGSNHYGQLGTGNLADSSVPRRVVDL